MKDEYEICDYCGESRDITSMVIIDHQDREESMYFCRSNCENDYINMIERE